MTDLGTLKFGKPYNFNFIVKNDSRDSVELKKLSVGCTSCTKATCPVTTVGPTEEAIINVVFTPGTMGKQRKSVVVQYNDTSLKMEFTANVIEG